jgi:hypothetical protein
VWDIRTGNEQKVVQAAAAAYNSAQKTVKAHVDYPYKQKLQVAMGWPTMVSVVPLWRRGVCLPPPLRQPPQDFYLKERLSNTQSHIIHIEVRRQSIVGCALEVDLDGLTFIGI